MAVPRGSVDCPGTRVTGDKQMIDDTDAVTTEEEFTRRLESLLASARTHGIDTDGTWTIPPYEVEIDGDDVHIRRDDESG